ncbi:MAG UNVERIFIED_CONTAM: MFS transporter [Rickettsiaceae bacterium]
MIDFLTRKVGLTPSELGLLAGIYYIGYSIAHIPVGISLDRYNPKYVIIFSILLCILGIYLTAFAQNSWEVFIARFIIGLGSVAGFLGAAKVVGDFYPSFFGLMLGLSVTIGFIGALYGSEPIIKIITNLSNEHAMQAIGLFAMILIASIWALYVSKPKPAYNANSYDIKNILKTAFSNKMLWIMGIFGGLMVAPLEGFAGIWGVKYLTDIRHLTNIEASLGITLIMIGASCGFPIMGFLTKSFNLKKMIIILGIITSILMIILLSNLDLSRNMIYILCFLIGFFTTHEIAIFTHIASKIEPKMMSVSIAITNMLIMFFGFIYQVSIGYILEIFFIPVENTMIYDIHAYQISLSIIVLGIALGVIGFSRSKF